MMSPDDEKLCVELEINARDLSKHYNRKAAARATLLNRAATRIRELAQ